MAVEYWEDGIHDGSRKSSKSGGKRKALIVVDDDHPFDLHAYISQYIGRTAVKRLRFIAEESHQLAPDALRYAIERLKQTRDVNLYQTTVSDYNSISAVKEPIHADIDWIDAVTSRNTREKDKLETELKTYSSNLIKESIRMGNRDLGDFFWATGDYTQSLRYYVKSREASTSTQHVLEFALTTIRLLLEYNDYAHISNYIYKAEAALAPTDQSKEAKKAPIPAAGSAAAAAAAASANNTDRDKAMAKLDLAAGIAYLGQGNFSKAAFAFSKVTGKALEDWYGSVIAPSDIATYGALTALASMNRSAIKVNYFENDNFSFFLEQEPYTRELLNAFMNNKFKTVMEILDRQANRHLLDMHLSRHVYAITSEIRKRAADLYFQPFASVQLEKMGAAFGVSVTEMERMAVELIQEGRIKARVDSTNKVLIAKQTEPRIELYQRAISATSKMQKTSSKMLLRMRLVHADLIVKAPKQHSATQQTGPVVGQSAFAADFYAAGPLGS